MQTEYRTIEVDRFVDVPAVFTDPIQVPAPPADLTFGQCVGEYAPTLIELIGQANRDRDQVRRLAGELVSED